MALRATTGIAITVPTHLIATAAPGAGVQLPVPYLHQLQSLWCWAACCQMVFEYYGRPRLQQCDLASRQFSANCCATPSSAACNLGCWPEVVYPLYNYRFAQTDTALTLADVTVELRSGRPVEVYYAWHQGGAHVALITAVFDNGDVWVHDPWRPYGPARRAFSFVQNAYNLGAWRITYTQISPPPAGTV